VSMGIFRLVYPMGGRGYTPMAGSGGGAASPVLILDQFTGTDSTALSAHTIAPTNTPAASWLAVSGVGECIILSNRASGGLAGGDFANVLNAGVANVTITFDFRVPTGQDYLEAWCRYLDIDNMLIFRIFVSIDTLVIYRKEAGAFNELVNVPCAMNLDTTYTASITLNGTALSLTVNGVTADTTSSFQQTQTKHGFHINSAGGGSPWIDNYQIATA